MADNSARSALVVDGLLTLRSLMLVLYFVVRKLCLLCAVSVSAVLFEVVVFLVVHFSFVFLFQASLLLSTTKLPTTTINSLASPPQTAVINYRNSMLY